MGNPDALHQVPHPETGEPTAVRADIGPTVYEHPIYIGDGGHAITMGADVNEMARHLATHTGPVTHLPGNEAFIKVVRDWPQHCDGLPTFVSCIAQGDEDEALVDDFERQLSEFYDDCPRDVPLDVEATHWTADGAPPGTSSGKFDYLTEG